MCKEMNNIYSGFIEVDTWKEQGLFKLHCWLPNKGLNNIDDFEDSVGITVVLFGRAWSFWKVVL